MHILLFCLFSFRPCFSVLIHSTLNWFLYFKKKTEKTSDLKCMTLMGSSLLFLFYFLQVPNHDHSCIFFHVLPRFQKLAHLPEQNSYVICIQISTDRMSNIAWIIINSLTVRVTDPACLMLALHRFINTANYSF